MLRSAPRSIPLAVDGFDANIARMIQTADPTFSQMLVATLPESLGRLEARSRLATFVARNATSGADVALRFGHHAHQRIMDLSMRHFTRALPTRVQAASLSGGSR
jgi:hypothetical protein